MSIPAVAQSPNPGESVSLYRLDLSPIGGTTLYFCQGTIGGEPVEFGGQAYTPYDIQVTDFQTNVGGVLPTPTMRVANVDSDRDGLIQAVVNSFGDLNGCELRRVRTYKRFLDGQPDADPTAYIGPDVFRVERKAQEDADVIEWELSAAIDHEDRMLPGRQVLRDTCVKRYRRYDPSHADAALDGYVYATVNACPYTGEAAFTASDEATSAVNDRCGRRLGSCQARFGANQPLPFGGFPGAARVRL